VIHLGLNESDSGSGNGCNGHKDQCNDGQTNAWYRCLDKVLEHRPALFRHLRRRWEDLFGVKFEVLLYDLTSTYFESDPSFPEGDKRRYG
jgi:hypothetical protein